MQYFRWTGTFKIQCKCTVFTHSLSVQTPRWMTAGATGPSAGTATRPTASPTAQTPSAPASLASRRPDIAPVEVGTPGWSPNGSPTSHPLYFGALGAVRQWMRWIMTVKHMLLNQNIHNLLPTRSFESFEFLFFWTCLIKDESWNDEKEMSWKKKLLGIHCSCVMFVKCGHVLAMVCGHCAVNPS